MATFSEIQDRVTRRVIDTPAAVVAEVPALINKALKDIQRVHNFRVMEAETSALVTVTGQRLLDDARASDWKEWRDKPYRLDEDPAYPHEMGWAPNRQALLRYWANDDDGAPMWLLDTPDGVEVWPLPDGLSDFAGGEYRIYIPYWAYLADLSDSNTSNWFTLNADYYLAYKATAEAFWLDWDEERASVWEQKAKNEQDKVILADKQQRLAQVDTLVPYWKGAHEPQLKDVRGAHRRPGTLGPYSG